MSVENEDTIWFSTPLKRLTMYYSEKEKRTASDFVNTATTGRKRLRIGIHMGCSGDNIGVHKRWPLERFAGLIKKAGQFNTQVLVFIGPQESGIEYERMKKQGCLIVKGFSLLEAAAIIKECDLFISNDSGLSHVAAAMEVPS